MTRFPHLAQIVKASASVLVLTSSLSASHDSAVKHQPHAGVETHKPHEAESRKPHEVELRKPHDAPARKAHPVASHPESKKPKAKPNKSATAGLVAPPSPQLSKH